MYQPCLNLATVIEEKEAKQAKAAEDQCPPGLPSGVCDMSNLKTHEGFVACEEACTPALCCMPPDGQPDCLMNCSGKCFMYQPCLNLATVIEEKEAKQAEKITPKPEEEEGGGGEENDAVVAGWTNTGILVTVLSVLVALPDPF